MLNRQDKKLKSDYLLIYQNLTEEDLRNLKANQLRKKETLV